MAATPTHKPDRDGGVVVERKTKQKLEKPKLYKVLLHNDDYTTMEFVVAILREVFHHNEVDATRIMLHVHQNGIGVAGVYKGGYRIPIGRVAVDMTSTKELEATIQAAMEEARKRRHEFLTLEHVLYAMTQDVISARILRACGADTVKLAAELEEV